MNLFNKHKTQHLKLKKFCKTATLVSATLLSEAHAAQMHTLNDRDAIEADISRQGLTRITIKQDRILNVFGITGEYILETDEDQGQIFVRPMGPGSQAPISLTLTTEKGLTQDLRLHPKDKAPEALILHLEESIDGFATGYRATEDRAKKKLAQEFPSRDDIEELIKACQEDRIPVGYKRMPLDIKPQKGPHRLIREIRGDSLKGLPLRGLTYEVKNVTAIPWILAESGFAEKLAIKVPFKGPPFKGVIAIFMSKKILQPGENAYVYVVAEAAE